MTNIKALSKQAEDITHAILIHGYAECETIDILPIKLRYQQDARHHIIKVMNGERTIIHRIKRSNIIRLQSTIMYYIYQAIYRHSDWIINYGRQE